MTINDHSGWRRSRSRTAVAGTCLELRDCRGNIRGSCRETYLSVLRGLVILTLEIQRCYEGTGGWCRGGGGYVEGWGESIE